MTTTDDTASPATGAGEAGEHHTELWTYAGLAAGSQRAKVAIWYDENRKRLAFKPIAGTWPAPGCVYRVEVSRDGSKVTRHGDPVFDGQSPDTDWATRCEAEAIAGEREIAKETLERKMNRDGGRLASLVAPIEDAARTMTYAQREALVALVSRRVYTAERPRKATS